MTQTVARDHEVVPAGTGPMSVDEADTLDRQIHSAIETTWGMLVEMNDRRGWEALGHPSMAAYLMETLDVKTSQAYRIINRVDAVKAIAEAVGDTSPETQARIAAAVSAKGADGIRPVLGEVAQDVADAVGAGEDVAAATAAAVAAKRTDKKRPVATEPGSDPDDGDGDSGGDGNETRAVPSGGAPFDPLLADLGPGELAELGLGTDGELADSGDDDRPARPARQDGSGVRDAPITGAPIGGGRVQYQETEDEVVFSGDGLALAHRQAEAAGRKTMPWESGYDDGHDGGEDLSRVMSEAPGHERTGRQRSTVPRPLPARPGRKVCPTCDGHADVPDTGRDD